MKKTQQLLTTTHCDCQPTGNPGDLWKMVELTGATWVAHPEGTRSYHPIFHPKRRWSHVRRLGGGGVWTVGDIPARKLTWLDGNSSNNCFFIFFPSSCYGSVLWGVYNVQYRDSGLQICGIVFLRMLWIVCRHWETKRLNGLNLSVSKGQIVATSQNRFTIVALRESTFILAASNFWGVDALPCFPTTTSQWSLMVYTQATLFASRLNNDPGVWVLDKIDR